MDTQKTSFDDSVDKNYAEIAKKTAAVISTEGLPPVIKNRNAIQNSLPQLSRY
jgi:hypothetical protein